jgi:hypothetical protein
MQEERRLAWRVLRHWIEIAQGGRLPRRNEIERWMLGEDGANCVLIGVESPIELSYFVSVGVNLAVTLCTADTLAGVLLSLTPQVVSARRGLTVDGVATLNGEGILYRSMLLPLSEDGVTIDHLLGAASYRALRSNEARPTQVIRRLPIVESPSDPFWR